MLFIVLDKSNLKPISDADGNTTIFEDYETANTYADKLEDGLPLRIDIPRPPRIKDRTFESFHSMELQQDIKNGTLDTGSGETFKYAIESALKTGREPEDEQSYNLTIWELTGIVGTYGLYNTKAEAEEDVDLLRELYDMDMEED